MCLVASIIFPPCWYAKDVRSWKSGWLAGPGLHLPGRHRQGHLIVAVFLRPRFPVALSAPGN